MRGGAALVLLALAACASTERPRAAAGERGPFVGAPAPAGPEEAQPLVVSAPPARDPLLWLNRGIFAFNDVLYRGALILLARGYNKVPRRARKSVANFFHNLRSPVYLLNHALQLRGARAGRTLGRLAVNSTAGLGGLFDPAEAWLGWSREPAHLHHTLAAYGAGYGIYLVLPLLGPSDLRSGVSLGAESFLSPIPYVLGEPEALALRSFDPFQEFAPRAPDYATLRAQAKDPYLFFRNLHLQGVQRDADAER
jgi:phospholipid-binding lipoprotein MlaA